MEAGVVCDCSCSADGGSAACVVVSQTPERAFESPGAFGMFTPMRQDDGLAKWAVRKLTGSSCSDEVCAAADADKQKAKNERRKT